MQDQGVTINGVWLEVRFEESAEGVEGAVLKVGGWEVGGFYVRLEVRLSLLITALMSSQVKTPTFCWGVI